MMHLQNLRNNLLDRERETETERDRDRQRETDRDRQRQTEREIFPLEKKLVYPFL